MSKNFFIKFVTSPDVDPLKCLVGLGCAAQAVNDGHKVDIFFAAAAVQMLHTEYLRNWRNLLMLQLECVKALLKQSKKEQTEFIAQLNHKPILEWVRTHPMLSLMVSI